MPLRSISRKQNRTIVIIALLIHILIMQVYAATGDQENIISSIEIKGNNIIKTETILFIIKSKIKEQFSSKKLRKDVEMLYKTGFFKDIQVEGEQTASGVNLTIIVEEKPIIRDVTFSGNKQMSDETLKEKISLKKNTIYRPEKVQEIISSIKEEYIKKGYNYAEIEPIAHQYNEDEIVLELKIFENAKVRIREIKFTGNSAFSDDKLKGVLTKTEEHWWMSWLTGSGKYSKERLEEDLDRLKSFYADRGYAKIKIGEPIVEIKNIPKSKKPKKAVFITIPLDEGDKYKIKEITIAPRKNSEEEQPQGAGFATESGTGKLVFEQNLYNRAIENAKKTNIFTRTIFSVGEQKLATGQAYNGTLVENARTNIMDMYHNHGYIDAVVYPRLGYDDLNKTVAVQFIIDEGSGKAYLNRVEFKGNKRTRDKVLRREMVLAEQDVFRADDFRASLARIYYLGYIENIVPDIKINRDDPDKPMVDVSISLEDQHRTELQFSGGWSSVDRFVFTTRLTEHNLFGKGQELSFSATIGKVRQYYNISFAEPWLFDTPTYAGAGIFNTVRNFNKFDEKGTGANISLGRRLTYNLSIRAQYEYKIVNITNISRSLKETEEENPQDLTDWERTILASEGKSRNSAMTLFSILDRRDNRRDPTKGNKLALTYEFGGGMLGGNNHYYKVNFDYAHYFPLWRNIVFAFHHELQYADTWGSHDFPVFEKYRMGGEYDVRGTGWDTIGPYDKHGDTTGGNKSLLFNSELIFPLAGPLKLVLFFDAGDLYDFDEKYDIRTLNKTVGTELRFYIPQFWVPIRFIWGYNLDALSFQPQSEFQFAIGTIF